VKLTTHIHTVPSCECVDL